MKTGLTLEETISFAAKNIKMALTFRKLENIKEGVSVQDDTPSSLIDSYWNILINEAALEPNWDSALLRILY